VPNAQSLAASEGRVNTAKLSYDNAKILYERNKSLFDKGVISKQDFENSELSFNQAKESLAQAQNDYQIIKKGSRAGSGSTANTNIIAQIPGTVLEIPIREGDQVIESNSFNAGTTIATVADMNKMIFEGKVDEAEVGKLKEGREIQIKLGAIEDKEFPGKLIFVAPKGQEESGAVQFTIKADLTLPDDVYIRAGYSANAEIELEKKDSVFSIKESLLQFERFTEEPYVEILKGENSYEKKNVKLGISDGINVEILEGIDAKDKIKIWNKATEEDNAEEDKK
jgi:HlyD family secretion protein